MWKFIPGISKPVEKRKTDEQKLAVKRKYDTFKRERKFQPEWIKEYPWLDYKVEEAAMFCKTCCEYAGKNEPNVFMTGCTSLRIDSIRSHNISQIHKRAVAAEKVFQATTSETPIVKGVANMNNQAFQKLAILFRSCHAIAKNARPFTDYIWQCELDEAKNLSIGQTYRTDKKCKEFISFIAEVEREKIEHQVKIANFLSITCDESTDSAAIEELIIYVHIAQEGKIYTYFLSLEPIEKADSINVYNAIFKAFDEQLNLSKEELTIKLIGIATDGAAVMQGVRNGVAARLKRENNKIQVIHCVAHRLQLAMKDVLKLFPFYEKIDQTLLTLYLFYSKSPLNRSMLKRSCEALNIPFIVPTRVGGTRWLSYTEHALTNLWKCYPAILMHLEQMKESTNCVAKAKADHLLKQFSSKIFVTWGFYLHDIIIILGYMEKKFQTSNLTLAQVPNIMKDTIINLEKLKIRPGPKYRDIDRFLSKLNHELRGSGMTEKVQTDLVTNVIEKLNGRFKDLDDDVIKNSTIIDFKNWPENINSATEFGDDAVAQLVNFYHTILETSGINPLVIEIEWTCLKTSIYKDEILVAGLKEITWEKINKKFKKECSNFLGLIDLLLSIPCHSADCERGFSHMKKIKNDWRNRLSSDSLNCLMRILLHSDDIKTFDPTKAIKLWNCAPVRKRRPFQKPYGPHVKFYNEEATSNSEEEEDDMICEINDSE